jgi:hypothetical protein
VTISNGNRGNKYENGKAIANHIAGSLIFDLMVETNATSQRR